MYLVINLLILLIILFLYIHIKSFCKISNDIDLFKLISPSKDIIQETSRFNQPIYITDINLDINNIDINWFIDNYSHYEINYKNIRDTIYDNLNINTLSSAINLFINDTSNIYISENNKEFIESTYLNEIINKNDIILRPYLLFNYEYDFIIGSINSYTRLQYSIINCNYILPVNGKIEVILYPPKYKNFLDFKEDYYNMKFISNIDIYDVSDIYLKNFNKCKSIKFIANSKDVIMIPMYWMYSIKLLEENTLVYNLKYKSLLNSLVNVKHDFIHLLQKYNKKIKQIDSNII